MSQRTYDPSRPYRCVDYYRMSSDKQNARSPEQQADTIRRTTERAGYPWILIKTYRDDAKSGRLIGRRYGFQDMLRDIELRILKVDLIRVDTLERLGRAEEIAEIRRRLEVQYGVLVVAADNGFADPTGVQGKAIGMVEQIRSTENTRITRHNVIRGKRDAVKQGRWPGGPPPFGYRLRPIIPAGGKLDDAYNELEFDPIEAPVMREAFRFAIESGFGDQRMARWWNANPAIPAECKPISLFTMGYRLTRRIYIGQLRWGDLCTALVDDTRIVEKNPDEPEVLDNYCEPLVALADFEALQDLRAERAAAIKNARANEAAAKADGKLIAAQAPGLTLVYLLSGLCRCASCGSSMRPVATGRRSKAGKKYVYYSCPRHFDGSCGNCHYVQEEGLRKAVISRLRSRLFPPPEQCGTVPTWYVEVDALVRANLRRREEEEPSRPVMARAEIDEVRKKLAGWSQTLANPTLLSDVRADIERDYSSGLARIRDLEHFIATEDSFQRLLSKTLDPKEVLHRLGRLDEILAAYNPTLGNLELSRHIAAITCHADGRVELMGTMLGLFAGAIELLTRRDPTPIVDGSPGENGFGPVIPRRRGRLSVPTLSAESRGSFETNLLSLDPARFAGIPENFFWKEVIDLEPARCWAENHALKVAERRAAGLTHEALAQEFGVTPPTIRHALRIAAGMQPAVSIMPRKIPRARWPEHHFVEVAELRRQGKSMKELCAHFGRSEPLIRTALRLAEERGRTDSDETPPSDSGPADSGEPG